MAMGLVALRSLLPSLSGLIREHAAFFVSNPTLPLSAMPFTPLLPAAKQSAARCSNVPGGFASSPKARG
jgi:hypothetical protein